ncbi:type IV pilin protein [Thalassotalea ganghwensis]
MNKTVGFTLIEVLITVAIIGILSAIVYPSYQNFVMVSKRTEAQRELARINNLQEQFFVDNRVYANNLTQLGLNANPFITEGGYYSISVNVNNNGAGYTLTATARGAQTADTGCTTLSVNQSGTRIAGAACWAH